MPVISTIAAMSARGFGEFNQQLSPKYIEDYFSSYLYTGDGSDQNITNNIGLESTSAWYTYTFLQTSTSLAKSCAVDASNNLYVAGTANDGSNYIFLAKYNPLGVLQWQRKLRQNSSSQGLVVLDSSGSPYLAGIANDGTYSYCILAKYDSSGAIQWQRKLANPSGNLTPYGITRDSSNNIFIVGSFGSNNYSFVAKYDSSGTFQWQRQFYNATTSFGQIFYGVAADSVGNIYTVGVNNGISLVKYNTSGVLQWKKILGSTGLSAKAITIDSSDNIYVAAYQASSATNIYIIKCNTLGTVQWIRNLAQGSLVLENSFGITADVAGDVYVTSKLSETVFTYMVIAKYNSSGSLQWQRKMYGTSPEGYDVKTDSSENLYCVGQSNSTAISIKLKTDGSTLSGNAFVQMFQGSATSTSITISEAIAGTDSAGTATDSAGSATDSAAGATSTLYTQPAIENGGGLVWIKTRSIASSNVLYDTNRGATYSLLSQATSAQSSQATGLTNFSASGFRIGSLATINSNAQTFASWTFRKSARFFEIISYTGTGVSRTISHNLGSAPGIIIIKRTNASGAWAVYHQSLGNTNYLLLNTTAASVANSTYWDNTSPTSTEFTVGTATAVNASGGTYVAYLFASDAGDFGLDGGQNVITCGSYAGNGSATGPSITLGYEPQFVMIKNAGAVGDWNIIDNMRGFASNAADSILSANTTSAESLVTAVSPNATGFSIQTTDANFNTASTTYVYLAIRRGLMQIPTSGTSVFLPTLVTSGTYNNVFPIDSQWKAIRTGNALNTAVDDRLRGVSTTATESGRYVITSSNSAEATTQATTLSWNNSGFSTPTYYSGNSSIFYNWRRAPSFMDVVCYNGTSSNTTIAHNLGFAPEMIIVKKRNGAGSWYVYHSALGNGKYIVINQTAASVTSSTAWNNTNPTLSVFSVGTDANVNGSGGTFVAYLFASCANVSKVGSYSGTGATQTINCGLPTGVRYVLIKRTDGTGDWFAWDTSRGMVAGTDPRLPYNSTSAETNSNWIYTTTNGFQIVTADSSVNANGGTYIYLAIA